MRLGQLACFAMVLAVGARADDIITNGNFTVGKTHWQGDGDVTEAGGTLFIVLKRDRWTVVSQRITAPSSQLQLKVTYSLSNFCTLLRRSTDEPVTPLTAQGLKAATGLPNRIRDMPLTGGATWLVLLLDDGQILRAVPVTLSSRESDPRTFDFGFSAGAQPFVNEVVCFAFPPGKGMVTIANVQLLRSR